MFAGPMWGMIALYCLHKPDNEYSIHMSFILFYIRFYAQALHNVLPTLSQKIIIIINTMLSHSPRKDN